MRAGRDFASIRSLGSTLGVIPAVPPRPFNPTAMSGLAGRSVVRSPEQLRLHRALEGLGWTGVIDEFNDAVRRKSPSIPEPILITTTGTILAGFGRWRLAVSEGSHQISCIEYELSENDSLQFILTHHQTRHGWNAFVRICLALTLEPALQQKALDNMRDGGKYKGLANLPDVQRINVRQEVADAASVGARNVANVKTLLKLAHPRLMEALRDGTLTINGAMQLCKVPRGQQLEQFIRYSEERATRKVIRQSVSRPRREKTSPNLSEVLETLRQQEARHPGSVRVQAGRLQRTLILIGQDLLTEAHSQRGWKLT
jgi:hypothetical protein